MNSNLTAAPTSAIRPWRLLRRHKIISTGCLIVSITVAAILGTTSPPTYVATGTALLIPGTGSFPEGDNPLLYISNLSQAADALVSASSGDSVQQRLLDRFTGSEITVARTDSSNGPILNIQTSSTSRVAAEKIHATVENDLRNQLEALQLKAAVPSESRIRLVTLTPLPDVQIENKSRYQAIALGLVGGVSVSVLLLASVEGYQRSRRQSVALQSRNAQERDT